MKKSFVFFGIIICFLSGCVNLQKVNDYSSSALKNLAGFDELGYTFRKACRDKCRFEQIRNLRLSANVCDCVSDKTADSVTAILFNAVKGYYVGLAKLSANNLTTYKFDPVTKILKSGRYGDVKIDKAEVDSYVKISGILLTAITNGYRKNKIKQYIEAANEPLQVLIQTLDFIMASNLMGRLNIYKERAESTYFDFVNDSLASSYEKKKAIEEYDAMIDETDVRQKQIIAFSKGLKNISAGHQKLFDHRNKMTGEEIKLMLTQHAGELEDLVSEFNKIKNN